MKKFQLRKASIEISRRDKHTLSALYGAGNDFEPEVLAEFPTAEEANAALASGGYRSSIQDFQANGLYRTLFTEYYVEENDFDDDGDWVDGGIIWDYTPFPAEDSDE